MAADEIPEGMRKCPFCAKIIRSEAKICRFCQRDLLSEPSQNSVAGSDIAEPRALRPGDRVFSATMGDGTVWGIYGASLRVCFNRRILPMTVAASELSLVAAARSVSVPNSSPDDGLIVAA